MTTKPEKIRSYMNFGSNPFQKKFERIPGKLQIDVKKLPAEPVGVPRLDPTFASVLSFKSATSLDLNYPDTVGHYFVKNLTGQGYSRRLEFWQIV